VADNFLEFFTRSFSKFLRQKNVDSLEDNTVGSNPAHSATVIIYEAVIRIKFWQVIAFVYENFTWWLVFYLRYSRNFGIVSLRVFLIDQFIILVDNYLLHDSFINIDFQLFVILNESPFTFLNKFILSSFAANFFVPSL
jgi:hypothetical protein